MGDVATDYIDLSLRGSLVSQIQPGKTYRVVIQEIVS